MTNNKFNFYNKDTKMTYINTLKNDSSINLTRSMFSVLKEEEERKEKDLYEMSLNEIKDVLQVYAYTKESTKVTKLNILERYIDWAIEQGLKYILLNPISNIDNKKEWVKNSL